MQPDQKIDYDWIGEYMERFNEKLHEALEDVFADVTANKVDYLIHEKNVAILPCKIGDRIYIVGSKYKHGDVERYVNSGHFCWGDMDKFGKTVFLTKKEAKIARDRMEAEGCLG